MSNRNKTLLITCTGKDYNKKLKAFCEYFSEDVTVQSVEDYDASKHTYDYVVIGPTFLRTTERETTLINTFNDFSFKANQGIIVLGDSNSAVMKNMGAKIEQINGHSLGKNTCVHNMKHYNGADLYIPSQHHTSFIPDETCVYNRDAQRYINLITLSYKRDEYFGMTGNEDEKSYNPAHLHHQEPEIFIIDAFQYLGIYGSPEFFFDDGDILTNHYATHTMTLIQQLIDDL